MEVMIAAVATAAETVAVAVTEFTGNRYISSGFPKGEAAFFMQLTAIRKSGIVLRNPIPKGSEGLGVTPRAVLMPG